MSSHYHSKYVLCSFLSSPSHSAYIPLFVVVLSPWILCSVLFRLPFLGFVFLRIAHLFLHAVYFIYYILSIHIIAVLNSRSDNFNILAMSGSMMDLSL